MKPIWLLASAALAAACGTTPKPVVEPPVKEPPVKEPVVTENPKPALLPKDAFLDECRKGLAAAKAVLPTIVKAAGDRTVDNTLVPYNQLLIGVSESGALAGLMSEVHPDADVRDAARVCE